MHLFYQAYYNWAIAISDRAKIRGRTKEAEDLWKQVGSQILSLWKQANVLHDNEPIHYH